MLRVIRLILLAVSIFLVIKLSTYGWQGLRRVQVITPKDSKLPGRLRSHVIMLSHEIGDRSVFQYSQLTRAVNYISSQFRGYGYKVEFQEYEVSGEKVKNIIAEKRGSENQDDIIIVGAHYDTCYNPGANDNASGVSAMLELARAAKSYDYPMTVRFVAFVNEEPPFFKTDKMGSFVYAKEAKEKGEKIKGAIILETIGYYSDKPFSQQYPPFIGPFYPNKANFIGVVGNFKVRELASKVTGSFRKHSSFPIRQTILFDFIPGVDFSDHWSFWQVGYPAIMITDTAFYRYRHYHLNSDTFDKLNYKALAMVVEGLEAVLVDIGR